MKIHSAEIVASAVAPDGWPPEDLPEVAVMGRSNVGKSSLLNRMVARRQLARTSSTPGKTRLLHFYEVALAGARLRLVDLPGYGYAKVSQQERRRWRGMIEAYLGERQNLRAAVLLQDARRDPQQDEIDLLAWLSEHQVPTVVALTKVDKLKAKEKVKRLRAVEAALPVQADWRIQTSAKTGVGVDRLWQVVISLL
ncbi:MAG: YihA family ribosome biogenesis GTP-binding protein [bacterium]|nr:YihA family ribosome biogenesis GTP-binding protein [bacterium]MCP5065649.1 YihA family ribosome biogenesis GTP-binding protein [bacterium]